MPKVGKLEFDYTEEGQEAAEQYAKATNQEIENSPGMEGRYPSSNAMERNQSIMGYGEENTKSGFEKFKTATPHMKTKKY